MSGEYTLKGLKCPYCGSGELAIKGTRGGTGRAVAGALLFGAVGNLVASAGVTGELELSELAYRCGACGKNFESLPLLAPEEEILSEPCRVTFVRDKNFVGCAVVQVVYLNGVKLGPVKNGQSMELRVRNRYNTLFVTDQYGAAFPDAARFEAVPGGSVTFHFNRRFL